MGTCFSMHSTFPHCIIDLPGTGLKLPLKTGTGGALLGDHSSLLADRHDPTPPPASFSDGYRRWHGFAMASKAYSNRPEPR